jgi:DNA-binding transcriptional regulator YiaG
MKPLKRSLPEWASKILKVRNRLGLNQAEFAARLNYSAMALSRTCGAEQFTIFD